MWDFSKREAGEASRGQAPTALAEPPQQQTSPQIPQQVGPEPELMEPSGEELPERYLARPVRPVAQLAVRVGLWAAVAIGCVGGLRALIAPGGGGEDPVVPTAASDELLPAPVAGIAETATQAWLTADQDDQGKLNSLFIDPPSVDEMRTETLTLLEVRTVAGERLEDGYWTATVAADVIETPQGEEVPVEGEDPSGEDTGPEIQTWYVELAIVGDARGALAVLTTPAIVPAPPAAESPWLPDLGQSMDPQADPELTETIEGFLRAMLAGDGDPSRYLAPHVEMAAADPAPFKQIEVLELAAQEVENGNFRIWVEVRATTETDAVQVVSYELEVSIRAGERYEVNTFWGAPTVEPVPEDDDRPTPAGPEETTEDTTEDSTDDSSEDSSSDDTSDTSVEPSDDLEDSESTTTTQIPAE